MSTAVATKPDSKSPYQLDLTQTTQACKVLLKQINDERTKRDQENSKPNLLSTDDQDDDEEPVDDETPVWMILNTKKHIVDQKRLKPSKISVPNSINGSSSATICLIVADPASAYRDAIDQPNFPAELRTRITRIIGYSKLKTDFKQFEARRKLFAEHDIFLADDRIITYLPKDLGSTFYKGGSKRPVPVTLGAQRERGEDGKRIKADPAELRKGKGVEGGRGAAGPVEIAKQVERAIDSALIHLAPGTTTSVKVGRSGMTAEQVSQNIEAVVSGLVEKFITKGWRNIRSIHIKGPETVALPVWLTNELWVEDEDVHEQKKMFGKKPRPLIDGAPSDGSAKQITNGPEGASNKKRKAESATKVDGDDKHAKKKAKQEQLAAELVSRKEKLKKQKEAVMSKATAEV